MPLENVKQEKSPAGGEFCPFELALGASLVRFSELKDPVDDPEQHEYVAQKLEMFRNDYLALCNKELESFEIRLAQINRLDQFVLTLEVGTHFAEFIFDLPEKRRAKRKKIERNSTKRGLANSLSFGVFR